MDSSDEEVLLESSYFLLYYHQEQIKKKRKGCGCGKYLKRRIEQGIYHVCIAGDACHAMLFV